MDPHHAKSRLLFLKTNNDITYFLFLSVLLTQMRLKFKFSSNFMLSTKTKSWESINVAREERLFPCDAEFPNNLHTTVKKSKAIIIFQVWEQCCALYSLSPKRKNKKKQRQTNKTKLDRYRKTCHRFLGRLKVEFHISSSVEHFLREDSAMHKSSLLTSKLCLAKVSDRIWSISS